MGGGGGAVMCGHTADYSGMWAGGGAGATHSMHASRTQHDMASVGTNGQILPCQQQTTQVYRGNVAAPPSPMP